MGVARQRRQTRGREVATRRDIHRYSTVPTRSARQFEIDSAGAEGEAHHDRHIRSRVFAHRGDLRLGAGNETPIGLASVVSRLPVR